MNVNPNRTKITKDPNKNFEFLAPLPVGNKSRKYIEGFLKAGPSIAVNRDYLGGYRIAQNDKKSKSTSVLSTPNDTRDNSLGNRSRRSVLSSAVSRKSESLNDDTLNEESSVVVAITEGRGHARGEVGLASIDTNRPKLILCQFSDDIWYTGTLTKLNMQRPVQIIIPETFTQMNNKSKLITFIKNIYPNAKIETIPRRHFSDALAKDYIDRLCSPKSENVKHMFQQKFYALAAAGALLKFLEFKRFSFARKTLKIEYETKYGNMSLDVESSDRLELLYPLSDTDEKRSCLYGVLNNCITAIGKRNLRAKILQPTCDIPTIESINQCIKELMLKDGVLADIYITLKSYYNVDRLLKLSYIVPQDDNIRAAEIMINLALLLKMCLENISPLQVALTNVESPVLVEMREALKDPRYSFLLEQINTILSSDAEHCTGNALYFQRLFTVKSNVNELLDLTRNIYLNWMDKMNAMVKELTKKFELPMKLIYAKNRGFHMQISLPKDREAPQMSDEFEILYTRGFNIFLTTSELTKMNFEINDVIDEIQIMSNVIISNLFMKLQNEIDSIYALTGLISELDIIQSLTVVSKAEGYCCPMFGDELRIVDAVHPFLGYSQTKPVCVPNNVIATPEFNFFIITGPNMGGKTVYIKMIGVLQVMAQLGCFIPAKEATFRICDKLFTRLGFGDKMEQCASSFTVEMRDMEYILKNITPNSLVLADELCRSTNPKEGKIIAWKICEQIIKMNGMGNNGIYFNNSNLNLENIRSVDKNISHITSPFVFLVTHFMELTKLSEKFKNVFNLFLESEEITVNGKTQLKFTHKVLTGVNPIRGYGMALARTVDFPFKIIPRAEKILKNIPQIRDEDISILEASINPLNLSNLNNTTLNTTFVNIIERKLYDLFSNIMTSYRNKNSSNAETDLNNILSQFLESQGSSFIDALTSAELNETIASYFVNETIRSTGTGMHTIENINDLSFHSIQRRLNEQNQSDGLPGMSNSTTGDLITATYVVHRNGEDANHKISHVSHLNNNVNSITDRKISNESETNRTTSTSTINRYYNNQSQRREQINAYNTATVNSDTNQFQLNVSNVIQNQFQPKHQQSQLSESYYTPLQPIELPNVAIKPRQKSLGMRLSTMRKPSFISNDDASKHITALQNNNFNQVRISTNNEHSIDHSIENLTKSNTNSNRKSSTITSKYYHQEDPNMELPSFMIPNDDLDSFFISSPVQNAPTTTPTRSGDLCDNKRQDQSQMSFLKQLQIPKNLSFLDNNNFDKIFSMASPLLFDSRQSSQRKLPTPFSERNILNSGGSNNRFQPMVGLNDENRHSSNRHCPKPDFSQLKRKSNDDDLFNSTLNSNSGYFNKEQVEDLVNNRNDNRVVKSLETIDDFNSCIFPNSPVSCKRRSLQGTPRISESKNVLQLITPTNKYNNHDHSTFVSGFSSPRHQTPSVFSRHDNHDSSDENNARANAISSRNSKNDFNSLFSDRTLIPPKNSQNRDFFNQSSTHLDDLFHNTEKRFAPNQFYSQHHEPNGGSSIRSGRNSIQPFINRNYNSENLLDSIQKDQNQSSFMNYLPTRVISQRDCQSRMASRLKINSQSKKKESYFTDFSSSSEIENADCVMSKCRTSIEMQKFLASDAEFDCALRMSDSDGSFEHPSPLETSFNNSTKNLNDSFKFDESNSKQSNDMSFFEKTNSPQHLITESRSARSMAVKIPSPNVSSIGCSDEMLQHATPYVDEEDIKREKLRQETEKFFEKNFKSKILQQTTFKKSKTKDNRIWKDGEIKSKNVKK